jgi:small subunit ribosomal protein S29
MSQSICSRCLSRSFQSLDIASTTSLSSSSTLQRAAFSTTPRASAAVTKKKPTAKPSTRQGKTLRLSKNKRDVGGGRPPAPGERKALRKRIVLGNPNALEVQGLQSLQGEYLSSQKLADVEGRVLALADKDVEALKALEAFKHTQGWHYFRKPTTLVRKDTVRLAETMESGGEAKRCFLFGEKGSGKSVLQLQAMALALQKGWVVVHLPNGV